MKLKASKLLKLGQFKLSNIQGQVNFVAVIVVAVVEAVSSSSRRCGPSTACFAW